MIVDIFIRTYSKDLEWLRYCLRSINKYVSGHRNVIISIPQSEKCMIDHWGLTRESVIGWNPVTKDGYIDQQIDKLLAYKRTNADYILFVDSDVCFFRPTDVRVEYFRDGKPLLMKTRYGLVGDAICWQKCTSEILGFNVEYEYMRRIPWLYSASTLARLDAKVNCHKLASLHRLSEFNLIGAFVDNHEPETYYIIDTEKDPIPPACAKQLWSWSGCNDEDKKEMEMYLNENN